MEAEWLGNKDLNLDNTSQSRRCCRYTIPQRQAIGGITSIAEIIIPAYRRFVKHFFEFFCLPCRTAIQRGHCVRSFFIYNLKEVSAVPFLCQRRSKRISRFPAPTQQAFLKGARGRHSDERRPFRTAEGVQFLNCRPKPALSL